MVDADQLPVIVRKAYLDKFGDEEEYNLHCQLIGMGSVPLPPLQKAIHTFDIEKSTPSDYLRNKSELAEAEDIFGS